MTRSFWMSLFMAGLAVMAAHAQQGVTPHQVEQIRRLIGVEFYACLDNGLRYPVEYQSAAANGQPVPRYKVPLGGKLTVEDVYPTNPTNYPGARVTLLLRAEDGMRVVTSAFLEPQDIDGPGIRSAIGSEHGQSGLRLRPIPGLYGDPKGRRYADVVCERGQPDYRNDYDDGQLQYVFDGGKLVLYVDKATGLVQNVQRFGVN